MELAVVEGARMVIMIQSCFFDKYHIQPHLCVFVCAFWANIIVVKAFYMSVIPLNGHQKGSHEIHVVVEGQAAMWVALQLDLYNIAIHCAICTACPAVQLLGYQFSGGMNL